MPFIQVNQNVAYVFVAAPVCFFFAWLSGKIKGLDDFELICFLVIKRGEIDAGLASLHGNSEGYHQEKGI